MLAEQPQIISLTQLAAVAGCSRDHITQLYLHWMATALTAATPKHAGTCGICAIHPATDR